MQVTTCLHFLTRVATIRIDCISLLLKLTRVCYSRIWMRSAQSLMIWEEGKRKLTRLHALLMVSVFSLGICLLLTVNLLGEGIFDRSDSGKSIPVNPLAWWHAQRLAGKEHDGLTQMAIDVLSTPGKPRSCLRQYDAN